MSGTPETDGLDLRRAHVAGYILTLAGFWCVGLALISPDPVSVAKALCLLALGFGFFSEPEADPHRQAATVLKDLEILLSGGFFLGILVGLTHPYVALWEGLYGGTLLWLGGRAVRLWKAYHLARVKPI